MSQAAASLHDMDGDNASGADNQQERPPVSFLLEQIPDDLGHYLAGFADGEGSFNVSFRPRSDYAVSWKVTLTFNMSQRDPTMLIAFKDVLGCGNIWRRGDGVWYYETRSLPMILERVIPFFRMFVIRSSRSRDFDTWCRIADLMRCGAHKDREGILEILTLRSPMNRGGKRRYPDEYILETL